MKLDASTGEDIVWREALNAVLRGWSSVPTHSMYVQDAVIIADEVVRKYRDRINGDK